ncbi:hypothetical protein RHSIM_Rhsim06G0192800 [Rhododendron simsii]|uniref:Hexosyltransferase n=1 Tax=Rhododendron simsii TaxID=118357 RepID=A0A834LK89_RHOSS|nr:hypothetical protein RHSIM_Rhsim06G0192800 [Rhododendron simsii]
MHFGFDSFYIFIPVGPPMRRRPVDFRRPARRRFSKVFWFTLCGVLFLIGFALFGRERGSTSTSAMVKRYYRRNKFMEGINITEEMLSPHSITRQLNDQIALAKALIVIAKESNNLQLAWQLSGQMRHSQLLLSNGATREIPLTGTESEIAIRDMAFLLYQADQLHYDSATLIMRLKSRIESLQELVHSVNFQKKLNGGNQIADKLKDNSLYHFCVFSDNILATSVVVNSTASNSFNPNLVVFHIVTDNINYAPMKAWFSMNTFRGLTIEVQNFEAFSWLNASYVPVLKQLQDSDTQNYYFSGNIDDSQAPIKYRNPKYLSMLNHLRFYIPEVFPSLDKVVFLDDDVVVQKDLSPLFSIDLNGNVNGAVETCMETFHRYHKYLNYSHPIIRAHFDPDACGWAFGMNIFDLVEWRKRNVTGIYQYWQEKNIDRTLWKLGTLPPGLLTFYGLTEPLDPNWHILGLGYTTVDQQLLQNGAVLHFNGNSKPWLKIGKGKYKLLWDKYVDYSQPILQQCNVH